MQYGVNITLERGTSCNPDVIRNRSDFRKNFYLCVFLRKTEKSQSRTQSLRTLCSADVPPPPLPLTKKPEDSGNEIGKVLARELTVRVDGQSEPTNCSVYSGFCLSL